MAEAVIDLFAPPRITSERRDDGTILLRSAEALGDYPPTLAHVFRSHAQAHPERLLAAERDRDGWRTLSWGAARELRDAVGALERAAGVGG